MKDIRLIKKNEASMEVWTSSEISRELTIAFSARVENYKFMPSYKQGHFDGWIRFYKSNLIPIGLLESVKEFAKEKNYSIDIDFDDKLNLDRKEFLKFIDYLDLPKNFELRDYQLDAAYDCINETKKCIKANTAAGKSLILYYIVRFMVLEGKKTLLVVPNTSLVEQMYKDWKEYGWREIGNYTTKIYSGQYKKYDSLVTIITYQSMSKASLKLFKEYDTLIVDEAHIQKAKSLMDIAKKCINAKWRLGFSGTFPEKNTVDWFSIVGSLGNIGQYTTYKSLLGAGQVSDLQIKNLFLNWPNEICKMNLIKNYKDYHKENQYIESIPKRIDFITKIAQNLKGNTIVLFTHIDYGKILFNSINDSKQAYYISGETKTEYRELIRSRMEKNDNIVLFSSFGTFSQGINVKNIHNVIMANNYKSLIKVVQSIGRAIRTLDNKKIATIYNIIDDFRYVKDKEVYINYSLLHHKKRLKIYEKEGYDKVENIRIRFDKKM